MSRRTARLPSGLAPRFARQALIAFVTVAALFLTVAGQAVSSPGDPPPVPTQEAREAFL